MLSIELLGAILSPYPINIASIFAVMESFTVFRFKIHFHFSTTLLSPTALARSSKSASLLIACTGSSFSAASTNL